MPKFSISYFDKEINMYVLKKSWTGFQCVTFTLEEHQEAWKYLQQKELWWKPKSKH